MKSKRPIFFLLHGPSVEKVEPRLEKMKALNPYWVTVNDFHVMEQKLGLTMDIVYRSARSKFAEHVPNLVRYVKEGGLYVTNPDIYERYPEMFDLMDEEDTKGCYILTNYAHEPGISHNSMTVLLMWLSANAMSEEIYLFGCDGGLPQGGSKVHYGDDIYPMPNNLEWLGKDTKTLNERFWGLYEKHDIKFKPRIVNVTDASYIEAFEKMSWKDFDAFLNEAPKESV